MNSSVKMKMNGISSVLSCKIDNFDVIRTRTHSIAATVDSRKVTCGLDCKALGNWAVS